jgi:MoxR-like ATPase
MPDQTIAEPFATSSPDRRDGTVYVMTDKLRMAVKVAVATQRPLLVRGDPGTGKSTLAAHVALHERWRYYEHVVTSRTLTQDLLWSFDHVRRFADVQVHAARNTKVNDYEYVTPGVLWWAFDRHSAVRRGAPDTYEQQPSPAVEPLADVNENRDGGVVVLIDEIDKADPDVPNGMLVPLGSREFTVTEIGARVQERHEEDQPPARLIVITTNEERELPQAFLRRCVVIQLEPPLKGELVHIAREHLNADGKPWSDDVAALAEALAVELVSMREHAEALRIRKPSTAEYLDALYACLSLGITIKDKRWKELRELTLYKGQFPEEKP